MNSKFSLGQTVRDFQLGINKLQRTPDFIKKHRLWHGFWNYGWATVFLLVAAIVVGSRFLEFFGHIMASFGNVNASEFGTSIGTLFSDIGTETYDLAVDSSFKWIILILMEVVIFHAVLKTLAILEGEALKPVSFKVFLKAQIRMFQLGIFSWVMELVLTILLKTGTGILGIAEINPVVIFLIQAFLLGFMMIDNYIEQKHDISMLASYKQSQNVMGLAIVIGTVVSVLLWLPLIGAFLAPLIGAVAASLAMYQIEKEQPFRIFTDDEMNHLV